MEKRRSIPIDRPLDLRRTLSHLEGRFADDGWWFPARTPDGPATLHVSRTATDVAGRAWGTGAEWLVGRLPAIVGMDDDSDALATDHPMVSELARRHRGYRFSATGLVFAALARAVVEQKVAGKEAGRSRAGLARKFSGPAPGPLPLRLPPDPERLAAAPYWEYHEVGIEQRRAETLRRLAAAHDRIERLADVSSAEARQVLESFRGVGEWTSAQTVAVSHGDPDAVAVGDYHFKNVVAWHLTGRPRGTDEEMLALLEPFRPQRGRVIRLLETVGGAPAFGPRRPLRNFSDR